MVSNQVAEHICTGCGKIVSRNNFTDRQWKKGFRGRGKCEWCQEQLKNMGTKGLLLQRNNSTSYGLIDGYQHCPPGNVRYDHARRANEEDKEKANDGLNMLLHNFNVTSIATIYNMIAQSMNCQSYLAFKRMIFHKHMLPIPSHAMSEFLTTLREPTVIHEKFRATPKASGVFPIGSFVDSTFMTTGSKLIFQCTKSEPQYLTSFPRDRIVQHVKGSVLLDSQSMLVGARCSTSLLCPTLEELYNVYCEMEVRRSFLKRAITQSC